MVSEVRELDRLLRPRSLAVVGDSRAAGRVIRQNRALGFRGPIWPVHPTAVAVSGEPAVARVADLPGRPDAAFVAVPAPACAGVVSDLVDAGCGGAVVYSSGFAETGPVGAQRQHALVAAAGGMPLLGPNCYGLVNYTDRVLIWPDQHGGPALPTGGRGVAVVSQSSSIAISVTMADIGLPLSHVLTVGNGAQIGVARAAEALLAASNPTAVGLILESLADVRGLERLAALARERRVGLVALVLGRSEPARRAVLSHTGSLAGPAAVGENLLRRIGIGEVGSVDALLAALALLHCGGPLTGARLSSLSSSGGEAALVADAAHGRRARFVELTGGQRAELRSVLGDRVALANPLDYHTYIWADEPAMTAAFTAMVRGPADLHLLFADLPRADRCADDDWRLAISAFHGACTAAGARGALVAAMGSNLTGPRAAEWLRCGLPVLAPPAVAVEAVEAAAAIGQAWATPPPEPITGPRPVPTGSGRERVLTEAAGKALLRRGGIGVPAGRTCTDPADAVVAAAELAGPYVLKGQGVAHKTEQQAIHIGLSDPDEVRAVATELLARFPAVLVEEMITDGSAELLVGIDADPVFGPVLTLGCGGVLTELWRDVAHLVLPVDPAAIQDALLGLRCAPLLTGFRGAAAVDLDLLTGTVHRLAEIALTAPDLVSLEVNPLIVTPDAAWACDALVVLAKGE
jgi:acetate---CoA ligase (ADP-forming)